MDLILAKRVVTDGVPQLLEVGFLTNYAFDGEVGGDNDFQLDLPKDMYDAVKDGYILIHGGCSEFGGRIRRVITDTSSDSIRFIGSTWLGILDDYAARPYGGKSYQNKSTSEIVTSMLEYAGISDLFCMDETSDSISYTAEAQHTLLYHFSAIFAAGSKRIGFVYDATQHKIKILAVQIATVTDDVLTSDKIAMHMELDTRPYTHFIAFSESSSTPYELYLQSDNTFGTTPYYTGIEARDYFYKSGESDTMKFRAEAAEKFKELIAAQNVKVDISDEVDVSIGDQVSAKDEYTKIRVTSVISRKILKIEVGESRIEYETKERK